MLTDILTLSVSVLSLLAPSPFFQQQAPTQDWQKNLDPKNFAALQVGNLSSFIIGIEQVPSLVRELGLTNEQRIKLAKMSKDVRSSLAQGIRDVHVSKDQSMQQQVAEAAEKGESLRRRVVDQAEQRVKDTILTKAQVERIQQIILQYRGLTALLDEDITKQLRLTERQERLLRELFALTSEAPERIAVSDRTDPRPPSGTDTRYSTSRSPGARTESLMMLVLTEEQHKKWNEMTGPKFEPKK